MRTPYYIAIFLDFLTRKRISYVNHTYKMQRSGEFYAFLRLFLHLFVENVDFDNK